MSTAAEPRAVEMRIAEIMIEELRLEGVTAETFDPDVDLVDELGIDSMDLTTVALLLQDEFAVAIDDEDYPQLTTLRKMAQYILAQKAK